MHPEIDNRTAFAFEPLFLADGEARPLLVAVIKGTFSIKGCGALVVCEEQLPVNTAGEFWGDPDTSSYKYEPECAFFKPATDIALIGRAYAPASGAREIGVALRVGPLEKTVRVIGDRFWFKALGGISMTKPAEFETIPLIYECAFGGWDRSNPDPGKHAFEPRNPVGTGFRVSSDGLEQGLRLPNLEDPRSLIRSFGEAPPPAGFGFTSPGWYPRATFAGTYDESWSRQRMPLLPRDFDCRFFNAASAGLIAPGFLRGDEPVVITNASSRGTLSFSLPGIASPKCRVQLRGRNDHDLQTRLDTVIINTDDDLVILIWRSNLVLRTGPQDVVAVEIQTKG